MPREHTASKRAGFWLTGLALAVVGLAVSCDQTPPQPKPEPSKPAARDAAPEPKPEPSKPQFVDEKGRDLLAQIVPMTIKDNTPLGNALLVFSMFGIKLEIDASITPEMRQQMVKKTMTFENTSFRDALTRFCDEHGLRYSIEDKQIVVRKK